MAIFMLFLILFAILLPGLMRFFFAMIGLFVIVMLTLAVAHAEPAGQDDIIIHDRTHYNNCTDSTYTKILPARPPYYILLTCLDPHNARVLPSCTAGGTSFCSMDDCDKVRLKFNHQWVEGAVSGMACGIVDEYGRTEIIRPTAQESSAIAHAEPADSNNGPTGCEPAFVRMDAELIHASVACNKNYMDTPIGIDVAELARTCYPTLGKAKFTAIIRTAMLNWEKVAKENGKKAACAETDKMFNSIKAAVQ